MIATPGTCWHCFLPAECTDEVTGEQLCRQHAGALAGHPEDCHCEADRVVRNHYDPSITSERAA